MQDAGCRIQDARYGMQDAGCRMSFQIIRTSDGSDTIFSSSVKENYHSSHGAVQESKHIFIDAGLMHIARGSTTLNILEVGFGTGLNALLTLIEAGTLGKKIIYTTIEAFPLDAGIWEKLNYPKIIAPTDYTEIFSILHLASWNRNVEISDLFRLHKIHKKLEDYQLADGAFDLVYFDAFSPVVQPELWSQAIFEKLYSAMTAGAILTTYSVKGEVIRAMKASGFSVEKIPGPPGKRHITRASK